LGAAFCKKKRIQGKETRRWPPTDAGKGTEKTDREKMQYSLHEVSSGVQEEGDGER